MNKLTIGISALALAATGTAFAAQQSGRGSADADNDGVVTRSEAQAHAGEMFAKMDANEDGKLDPADRDARMAERRQKMFEALDADSNGQVSRDEFMAFNHEGMHGKRGKHRMGHKRGHRGARMMQMADANDDGAVSKAEFTAGALKRFDAADANNDGSVTKEERDAARKEMRGKWREKMRDRASS